MIFIYPNLFVSSAVYQRLAWEALKKSIQGHVNKVNISNIRLIFRAVLKENIVRGRGLLCRALVQAQAASPSFTNVYSSFVCILNAKVSKVLPCRYQSISLSKKLVLRYDELQKKKRIHYNNNIYGHIAKFSYLY